VDGTVAQLAVHTVGGVVTAAQPLLAVVPADGELEVEAIVPNREVGFLRAGQEAEIKVDAFNITRYDLVTGQVLAISTDAIARGSASRCGPRSAAVLGLEYVARGTLERGNIERGNAGLTLSPGMTVTVEIKTGARTVMEYLLSTLGRYRPASLRER